MEMSDLKVFAAVARRGSMKRAAEDLHTVQSNVTTRIRLLEEQLRVRLFDRHARGVTTTPAGRRLLPFVERMAALAADARAAVLDEGEPTGTLRVGSLETTAALRLSPLLSRFAAQYPAVRLAMVTGTTRALVEQVAAGTLEGAFVAAPVRHPALVQEVVFREELVLVTAPGIAPAAPGLQALAGVEDLRTVVFQAGCSYRQRLEALLAGWGIVTARPLELGSLDAIIGCVAAGIGITLLPRGVVAPAATEGRVSAHTVPGGQGRVDTLFVRRQDGYVSSAQAAFLTLARETGGGVAGVNASARTQPAVCPTRTAPGAPG
ncbi:LysR family transcriptional regulator [Xylophilus sp.]|uniref:LysR family transcriptional regulator n=1 Tax=Xylophilus sp. TaxID=2653893 RepID=UPI0013BA6FD2|nr:LysR family transcriptional regulator [Xylophilus sp.]KAF1048796.1 MAG: HTH-type transcriptional regulator GltR [Xylophilus sp.]